MGTAASRRWKFLDWRLVQLQLDKEHEKEKFPDGQIRQPWGRMNGKRKVLKHVRNGEDSIVHTFMSRDCVWFSGTRCS